MRNGFFSGARLSLSGLRVRLLALVLLAVVPALGLILYNATELRRTAEREAREEALRLALFAAKDQAAMLEGAHQLLAGLAQIPEVREGSPDACRRLLASVVEGFPRYLNLGMLRSDGTLLCSGRQPPPSVPMVTGPALLDAFRRAVATRDVAVSDFTLGRASGQPVLMFAYPVLGPGGRVRSVVFASMGLRWLNRTSAEVRLPPGSTLAVTDRKGTVLVRHPDPERWMGKPLPEGPLPRGGAAAGRTLTATGPDGVVRLHGVARLPDVRGEEIAFVSIGIPARAAYASADRALRRSLAILALLSLLALAAAWVGGDLFVLRRVEALVAATRRLESGDLGARTGLDVGGGELGQLALAFDRMAGALQRRQAEAEAAQRVLREREEQLRRAQKMEAVGRLAGGVAHDFNNLLTAIRGSTELALHDLPADSPVREDLEQVRGATDRAAALTRQLLTLGRQQPMQTRVLDLNAVVSGTERMLRRLLGRDVEVATELEPGPLAVRADPGQLEQVLLNLAINARDAMPGGGRLTLRTARVPAEGGEPGGVALEVADTGVGMDAETLERIWEPFFTTKEPGKGTGLGLAMVYGIVEQSGGDVRVESAPGRGSVFRIHLPRAGAEAEPAAPGAESPERPRGSETILLVEDEAQVRALARRVLAGSGYTVLEAESGEDALRLLREHGGPVHLLLTDVVMPGMSGPEVARRVGDARPGVRVLYMSGYTDEKLSTADLRRGGLLLKPFSVDELVRRVRAAIDAPAGG